MGCAFLFSTLAISDAAHQVYNYFVLGGWYGRNQSKFWGLLVVFSIFTLMIYLIGGTSFIFAVMTAFVAILFIVTCFESKLMKKKTDS